METNQQMLELLRSRGLRKELHGYGVRTADEYVVGVLDCLPHAPYDEELQRALAGSSREELLKEAGQRFVYANEETVCDGMLTSSHDMAEYCKSLKVELPPRTLMVFDAVVTTPRRDRDGDILRTEGATVDPKMPTLWHHMLPMAVGRLLKVLQHSARRLKVASTLIDSALGTDTAHLMEHGALRISHGFRPTKFEAIQSKEDEPPGFDVKEFEVLEMSLVTVPSNPDALITAYSRGKLHSPTIKEWARQAYESRPLVVPVQVDVLAAQSIAEDIATDITEKHGSQTNFPVRPSHLPVSEWIDEPLEECGFTPSEKREATKTILDDTESGGEEAAPPVFDAEAAIDEKPYPNEHSARLREPGDFKPDKDKWGRTHGGTAIVPGAGKVTVPATIDIIWGQLKTQSGEQATAQAFRFPIKTWTAAQAKKWLKDHKVKVLQFEAAAKEAEAEPEVVGIPLETLMPERPLEKVLEKAGRALSKANESRIRDARDDATEIKNDAKATRAIKALAANAANRLTQVLDALSEPEEEETTKPKRALSADAIRAAVRQGAEQANSGAKQGL